MVKPAVMMRRDERPPRRPAYPRPIGNGVGIPSATFSELAGILLSSGRRDQAIDISSEVMSIADGVHQILFIPWAGRERTTFGTEGGDTGSYYEYTWAHGTSPRLSETQRLRSQDRGDGAGAGHGGLWERYPRPMVKL